jgi:hypothetical protein
VVFHWFDITSYVDIPKSLMVVPAGYAPPN